MSDLLIAFVQACLVSALSPEQPLRCGVLEDTSAKYATIEECSTQKDFMVDSIGKRLIIGIPKERIEQFKLGMPWTFYCIKESEKEKFLNDIGAQNEKPKQDI